MASRTAYFNEIVGFRIYLALWVAIGHALQLAGYLEGHNPLTKFLLRGHDAVVLFMIVSGFVITNLLTVKHEAYAPYITRRFFRLFPAYALACAAGYFVIDEWATVARSAPWALEPNWADYAKNVYGLQYQVTYNFFPHFLAHVSLLHGLIPNEILDRSPQTFLPAAWSISLEWQFYLIAPLVIAAFKSQRGIFFTVLLSIVMLIAYNRGYLGSYVIASNIAGNVHFFFLGILSRLGYERLAAVNFSPIVASAVIAFAGLSVIKEPLPYVIWGCFYSYSLWHENSKITGKIFRLATQSKPVMILGEASFSVYLIHRPMQVGAVFLLMGIAPLTKFSALAAQGIAVLLALPLSVLLYFTVEKWGIHAGKLLAGRMTRKIDEA